VGRGIRIVDRPRGLLDPENPAQRTQQRRHTRITGKDRGHLGFGQELAQPGAMDRAMPTVDRRHPGEFVQHHTE
jgi:hypothetical protein